MIRILYDDAGKLFFMDHHRENSPCEPAENEDGQRGNKEEEKLVVPTANTVVYPGAMVVEILEWEGYVT